MTASLFIFDFILIKTQKFTVDNSMTNSKKSSNDCKFFAVLLFTVYLHMGQLDGLGVNQLLELLLLGDQKVVLMSVSLGRDSVVAWTVGGHSYYSETVQMYRGQHSVHQPQGRGSWRGRWRPGWPGRRRSGQGWC